MFKKLVAVITALSIILVLAGCRNIGKDRHTAQFLEFFDTVTEITAYTENDEEFNEFSGFVYESLKAYHELYDIYNDYDGISNIKTINDNAGIAPVKVDSRIIDMLLFAVKQEKDTKGAVNVAMGSVLKIWKQYRDEGVKDTDNAKLPPKNVLKAAAEHTDIDNVVIDRQASTVYLPDPEMSLDVGAVAKGYAVEQICKALIEKGYTSAIINVGGNVKTIGEKGNNDSPWNIGVRDPENSEKLLCTAEINGKSLVTSGVYERFYTVNGVNYHHIIDPKTLMPSVNFISVTIICEDSGLADALSTALFNMSLEDGKSYIKSLGGVEALWVLPDGKQSFSDGLKQYIKN